MLQRNRKIQICLLVLLFYCISYIILSELGDYEITTSGKIRYIKDLAVMDRQKWKPKFVKGELFRDVKGKLVVKSCNFLGAFYSPLLYLDRKLFHKTIRYFEDSVSLITPVRDDPFSKLCRLLSDPVSA